MTIKETTIALVAYSYHLNALYLNKFLNDLGIREDGKADKKCEHHVTSVVLDLFSAGYNNDLINKEKEKLYKKFGKES